MTRPWYVVALGRSPGEAGLASHYAREARDRQHPVIVWTIGDPNRRVLEACCTELRELPSSDVFLQAAAVERPEVVVCSISVTCGPLLKELWNWHGPVVSLDANWQPWLLDDVHTMARIDRTLVCMPGEVWRAGHRHEGGPFVMSDNHLGRSLAVGWMASRAPEEPPCDGLRRVFLYFGGAGDNPDATWLSSLGEAVEQVAVDYPDVRWVYRGGDLLALPGLVERQKDWVTEEQFDDWIRRSDALVCHHGMGTISRAMVAGTPVVAITPDRAFRGKHGSWAELEMHALERAGRVSHCSHPSAPSLARRIRAVLEEGRREPEPADGARRAVNETERILVGS